MVSVSASCLHVNHGQSVVFTFDANIKTLKNQIIPTHTQGFKWLIKAKWGTKRVLTYLPFARGSC